MEIQVPATTVQIITICMNSCATRPVQFKDISKTQ